MRILLKNELFTVDAFNSRDEKCRINKSWNYILKKQRIRNKKHLILTLKSRNSFLKIEKYFTVVFVESIRELTFFVIVASCIKRNVLRLKTLSIAETKWWYFCSRTYDNVTRTVY